MQDLEIMGRSIEIEAEDVQEQVLEVTKPILKLNLEQLKKTG
jgi:hypothetical protein